MAAKRARRVARGGVAVHLGSMSPSPSAESPAAGIHVRQGPHGALTYLVDTAPEALPPVRLRDIVAAWENARAAARAEAWGCARLFRFRHPDGETTELALADPDACCWAGAVDTTMGIHTPYGLALCLRLLALVDLLARARWAAPLFRLTRSGAELDPSLLRAAAMAPLNGQARFDESPFRALLAGRLAAPHGPLAAGA